MSETPSTEKLIGRTLGNLQDLSRVWATQGLTAGKAAIESSADRLKATAEYLGDLSARINATDPAEDAGTAETAEEEAE